MHPEMPQEERFAKRAGMMLWRETNKKMPVQVKP